MIKEVPNPTLECIGCIFKDALQCLSMPCFADKDNPIKYIEVNEDINEMAFNDFIYNVKYFTGNKYLVTGDLLDETGTIN